MALWLSALAVCLLGAVAGIGYAAWHGLELWRGAKRTLAVLEAAGDRVGDGLEELTAQSERVAAAPGRLGDAGAELKRSVAAARVVAAAAAEARAAADTATALLRHR